MPQKATSSKQKPQKAQLSGARSTGATQPKDYEKLGRQLESLYASLQLDRRKFYSLSLMRGVLTGIGSVLGATVGIALLLWVLSWFGELPFVGGFVETLQRTINSNE